MLCGSIICFSISFQKLVANRAAGHQSASAFLGHCRESYEDNILTLVRKLFTTAKRPVNRPLSAVRNPRRRCRRRRRLLAGFCPCRPPARILPRPLPELSLRSEERR